MRLVTSVMLALCVALPAPIVANASESVNPVHKHRIHQQLAVTGRFNPAAATLSGAAYPVENGGIVAPSHRTVHHMAKFAKATALVAPALPAARSSSLPETDGLSRNDEDCNYGCIDH